MSMKLNVENARVLVFSKKKLILPLGYFAYLFLVRILLNDVLGDWLNAHISQDVPGSCVWALIKGVHWCLPIVLYLTWRRRLISYLMQKYGRGIQSWPLLFVPLGWGLILLLQDHGKIPPLTFYLVLNSIMVTPLVEEFVFRGFMLDTLTSLWGSRKSNMAQAVLFSLNHLPWFYALGLFGQPLFLAGRLIFLMVFGLVAGYLAMRSRALWLSMAFHAVNNLLASG